MVRERFPRCPETQNESFLISFDMAYYHDLITEKSWKFLQEFHKKYSFTLIGGWAVYLYTHGLKSRDIDIICDYVVLEKFKNDFDLVKNDRLKKYEIHAGEFDVDIYVPFYSDLGLPIDIIQKNTRELDGFSVPSPETLLILKQKAWIARQASLKGEKDKIDIIALLTIPFDFKRYQALLREHHLEHYLDEIKKILEDTREVPELDLNQHRFSQLKADIILKMKHL